MSTIVDNTIRAAAIGVAAALVHGAVCVLVIAHRRTAR